ncbi:MAG TPA: efflux RND transporter periplasmic adaptor subunit [Dissulfurispiraceae bacterium]|nr:efflux RND transporter periplasmic adaptor subunit [Dissulfurispiraceae bacterium]
MNCRSLLARLHSESGYSALHLLTVFILLTLAASLSACGSKDSKPQERALNVQVAPAGKQALRPYLSATGSLNPFEEAIVSSEIEAVVKDIRAEEGTRVAKGAVLAVLNDTDYALDAKRNTAALNQAKATLKNTQIEFQRKEALYKEQLVTQQQFDDIVTRRALAEADVERAHASLALTQERLAKTRIVAPFAGVVKEKKISRGDFVKNGSPAFAVIQTHILKLNFSVPERDVGKLRQGQEVAIRVDAFPEREFTGKINIVSPSLDDKTRTLKIEALIPNDDNILKPGLFARVQHYTGPVRAVIVVPIVAVLYEGEQVRIFTVEGDRAKVRNVKLGNKYGETIEVIEGLNEGEQVVVIGQQNLSEGAKVNVAR